MERTIFILKNQKTKKIKKIKKTKKKQKKQKKQKKRTKKIHFFDVYILGWGFRYFGLRCEVRLLYPTTDCIENGWKTQFWVHEFLDVYTLWDGVGFVSVG